ncbi:MAG: hypothetical protein KDA41_13405, partial [Planctomycetales bacterium]|nr:hypothetical protein [Planctomycetales bacterium]
MNAQQLGALALRVVAAVVVVAACIYLAANLGAAMAIARVAGLLRQQQQQQHQPPAAPTPQVIVSADASEIDFCPASGISPERLKQYFDQMRGEQPTAAPTLALILKNAQGESLFDGNVLVRFSGGER